MVEQIQHLYEFDISNNPSEISEYDNNFIIF